MLTFGRKVMTNLDSILKNRDITWPTQVCLVETMVFPVVMYGCESLLKHHSSKASVLWHSAFFIVQFSYPYYITTGKKKKNIALNRWTFMGKIMSLLFNTLSRFVTAFLPRSKRF